MSNEAKPFAYPAKVVEDGGAFVVSFRDVPEAITQVEKREEIVKAGISVLQDAAIGIYMEDHRPFPLASKPRKGEVLVELPLSFAAKIALYNTMIERRYRQADLAKLLDVPTSEVARLVNPNKRIKIDTLCAAVQAMGGSLSLSFRA